MEELRAVLENMADWLANSYPTWAAYCALMEFWLVSVDKMPCVIPVEIGVLDLSDSTDSLLGLQSYWNPVTTE